MLPYFYSFVFFVEISQLTNLFLSLGGILHADFKHLSGLSSFMNKSQIWPPTQTGFVLSNPAPGRVTKSESGQALIYSVIVMLWVCLGACRRFVSWWWWWSSVA